MKTKMIVTNLRMPEYVWAMMKASAAENGMSFNEYINWLAIDKTQKAELGYSETPKKKESIRDLPQIARKLAKKTKYELSEDDKIIYGL